MTLRGKLLSGFSGILLLLLILAFVSWNAMDGLNRRSAIVVELQSMIIDIVEGQVGQLRFALYKTPQYAQVTRTNLNEALTKASDAKKLTVTSQVRSAIQQEENNIREFGKIFDSFESSTKEQLNLQARFSLLGDEVEKPLDSLLDYSRKQLLTNRNNIIAFEIFNLSNEMLRSFGQIRTAMLQYMRDPDDKEYRNVEQKLNAMQAEFERCATMLESNEAKRLLQEVSASFTKYRELLVIFAQNARQTETLHQKSASSIDALVRNGVSLSKQVVDVATKSKDRAELSVVLVSVFSLMVGAALALFLNANVNRQLGADPAALVGLAERVSKGEYDVDDGRRHHGVYRALLEMVAQLKKNIAYANQQTEEARLKGEQAAAATEKAREAQAAAEQAKRNGMQAAATQLESVVTTISSVSTQLSNQIEQSERGASEQAVRITETATAMEEMNSTVIEVAKNAGAASDISSRTRDKADTGADIVRKAVESIRQVQKESLALKEDMTALGEHTQAISQIMSVISDIADQTNLLALNAAIEAARAGEAGRGFAVVADEVRKLAEKTMASTSNVSSAINSIQDSAQKSMQQVDRAVKVIEEATDLASQSGHALKEIVHMADSTADQVRAIATASEQQSASSEEINHSITQVNTIAGETARSMEDAARAVAELADQTKVLSRLITDMKRG